jgi:hypothetical protein
MKGDKPAYDENYHIGVNIIRSHGNSTGKTTIMDAIFFVLGGDVEDWTGEAMACDCVVAEISFRKKILTFRREIGSFRFPPIYIYEGPYTEAVKNSLNWLKFAHKRSNDRESFSQAIFRLLGYPENKLSTFANITIHEILRLVYSDQLTAVSNLIGRLKATQEVFTSAGMTPDNSSIVSQIEQITKEYDELRERISYLESPVKKVKSVEESEDVRQIRQDLRQTKQSLRVHRDRREELTYEIEDSVFFISSLKERKNALDQSEVTRESLGELKFEFCPACLSEIATHSNRILADAI